MKDFEFPLEGPQLSKREKTESREKFANGFTAISARYMEFLNNFKDPAY
jgi:hypothetical protein